MFFQQSVAWVNIALFDYKGYLKCETARLNMWECFADDETFNHIGWYTCSREGEKERERKREREISFYKNKEYKRKKIFYMDVLKNNPQKDKQSKNEVKRKR